MGARLLDALRQTPFTRPEDVVLAFAGLFRRLIVESGTDAGCAVAAVASSAAAGSAPAEAAAPVFTAWEEELTAALTRAGLPPSRSSAAALVTVAVVEGALVLARAHRDVQPFDMAIYQLLLLMAPDGSADSWALTSNVVFGVPGDGG